MSLTTIYLKNIFPKPPNVFEPTTDNSGIINLGFDFEYTNINIDIPILNWYNIDPITYKKTDIIKPNSKKGTIKVLSNNFILFSVSNVIFDKDNNIYNLKDRSSEIQVKFINIPSFNEANFYYPLSKSRYIGTFEYRVDSSFCFSEGTKILGLTAQLKEEYRLVQDLMVGDFVKSYLHGYRRVSKIISGSFVNNPKDEGVSNCMYIMKMTKDNGLIEDLTLTRNHGVLVEKLTENEEKKVDINNLPIIDGLLSIITADCDKFEKVMDTNVYKYYHFTLETDGDEDRRFGVYANGLLVEVPSNNMLDNALNVKPLDF
jgi:hypothetical protein